MPDVPPVTTATLFWSFPMLIFLSSDRLGLSELRRAFSEHAGCFEPSGRRWLMQRSRRRPVVILALHRLLYSAILRNTHYRCRTRRIGCVILPSNVKMAGKRMNTGNGNTGRPISFNNDAALEAAMLLI